MLTVSRKHDLGSDHLAILEGDGGSVKVVPDDLGVVDDLDAVFDGPCKQPGVQVCSVDVKIGRSPERFCFVQGDDADCAAILPSAEMVRLCPTVLDLSEINVPSPKQSRRIWR